MATVTEVQAKGDKAAILVMDDGSRVWTPEKDKADALVGKPIPGDWTQKEGDYGPQAFPPREKKGFGGGGGAAAYRNTKEGQAYEQERMDRRTALMQAVYACGEGAYAKGTADWSSLADGFYTWLRKTAGGGGIGEVRSPSASTSTPAASTGNPGETTGDEAAGSPGGGGGHTHSFERIPNVTKFVRCACGETSKA